MIPGAAWHSLNRVGYISVIGWIWVVSMVVVSALAVPGIQLFRLTAERTSIAGTAIEAAPLVGGEANPILLAIVDTAVAGALIIATAIWRLRRCSFVGTPPSLRALPGSMHLARS